MDRFDLEQQIMNLHCVADDLDLLHENVLESDLSYDEIANALAGISALLKMRSDKLYNTMVEVLELN